MTSLRFWTQFRLEGTATDLSRFLSPKGRIAYQVGRGVLNIVRRKAPPAARHLVKMAKRAFPRRRGHTPSKRRRGGRSGRASKRFRASAGVAGVRRRRLAPARGLPQKAIVMLPFWQQSTIDKLVTAGLAEPSHEVFRLNDIFDPLGGAGALQPHYRDQWAIFFQKYRVLACKWSVTAYLDSTTNTGTDAYLTATVIPADTSITVMNTTEEIMQSKRFQKRSMRVHNSNTSKSVTLHGYAKIQNYVQSRNPEDLGALMSASPTDLVELHVGYCNAYGGDAVAAATIRYFVRLEFTTMLYSPIVIGQS